MDNIKSFLIKYRGAIIGGLIALITLILNLYKIMFGIVVLLAGIVIGNYVQHNKKINKTNLLSSFKDREEKLKKVREQINAIPEYKLNAIEQVKDKIKNIVDKL